MGQKHDLLQDWEAPDFGKNGTTIKAEDITRNVVPLKCHSHNDYWRRVPLYQALHAGCTSVEPWERDLHARADMKADAHDAAIDDHIYFSKEASSGGRSFAGGGCGCN